MSAASPCIGVCEMDRETGLCRGCLRNLVEISRWTAMSHGERGRVLAAVARRRATRQSVAEPR